MKNKLCVIGLLMFIMASTGCASQDDENLSENLQQEESQNEEENADELGDNAMNPVVYENTLEGLVDLSNVENISNLDYEVELEGDFSAFVKLSVKTNEGKLIQEIEYQSNMNQEWYDEYTKNGGEVVRFFDINFDGYTDLVCQFMGAVPNQSYCIMLYNTETDQFEITQEYDALINPKVDGKMILSSNYAMSNISHELFEVVDGHLSYIGQLTIELDENGEFKYIEQMYADIDEQGKQIKFEVQTHNEVNDIKDLSKIWGAFTEWLD